MSREIFNLRQAAEHVHLEMNALRHFAQRGEVAAESRGGEWFFEHRALDEWAQRNLLAVSDRELAAQHRVIMDENRRQHQSDWGVAGLINPQAVELSVQAKAKAGVIRDLAEIAARSNLVYDPEGLYHELAEREATASTAVGAGVALLHPRFHDPYLFEASFVAYGRSERPIFFGAPDGQATRHFFVVCSTNHEEHLHILARLAMLAHGSALLEQLELAVDAEGVIAAIREREAEYR